MFKGLKANLKASHNLIDKKNYSKRYFNWYNTVIIKTVIWLKTAFKMLKIKKIKSYI